MIGEDIEISMVLGTALGRVKADQGQIEQIVMNLTVNSRDAMPDGGKLFIETTNAEIDLTFAKRYSYPVQQGSYVLLTVSDTGIGMDAATQAHIFEPFFTTKEKGKGTGLGLATAYGIVKRVAAISTSIASWAKVQLSRFICPECTMPSTLTRLRRLTC